MKGEYTVESIQQKGEYRVDESIATLKDQSGNYAAAYLFDELDEDISSNLMSTNYGVETWTDIGPEGDLSDWISRGARLAACEDH